MSQVIHAIFEEGVLRPLDRLDLPEHQEVRVTVEPVAPGAPETPRGETADDPLAGIRVSTGIQDLAEHFDDYRLGRRRS